MTGVLAAKIHCKWLISASLDLRVPFGIHSTCHIIAALIMAILPPGSHYKDISAIYTMRIVHYLHYHLPHNRIHRHHACTARATIA